MVLPRVMPPKDASLSGTLPTMAAKPVLISSVERAKSITAIFLNIIHNSSSIIPRYGLRRIANIDGFNDRRYHLSSVYVFDLNDFTFLGQVAVRTLDETSFSVQFIDRRFRNAYSDSQWCSQAVIGRYIEFFYRTVLGVFNDVKAVAVDVVEGILMDVVLGRDSIVRSAVHALNVTHGAPQGDAAESASLSGMGPVTTAKQVLANSVVREKAMTATFLNMIENPPLLSITFSI